MKSPEGRPRLLVTAESFPDESLRGYLLRLCELNGYQRVRWLTKFALYGDYITPPSAQAFRILSQLTGADAEKLQRFAYNEIQKISTDRRHVRYCRFGNTQIKSYLVEQKHPRVCPRCLVEAPYIRAIWDIKLVTTCAKHETALIERCPRCKKPLSWSRGAVAFCSCGFDLRHAKSVTIAGPELELNKFMYNASGLHNLTFCSNYGLPSVELAPLGLASLLDLIQFAGRVSQLAVSRQVSTYSRLAVQLATALTKSSAAFLSDWPKNFQALLCNIVGRQEKSALFSVGRRLNKLYRCTFVFVKQQEYKFVQEIVRDLMHKEWDGRYARSSTFMPELQRSTTQYLTGHDVVRLLKCDPQTVPRLLERGLLKSPVTGKHNRRVLLVTRRSAEALSSFLSSSVGLCKTAKMLGVTARTVRLLEKGRLIISRPNPVRQQARHFVRDDIDMLLSNIDKRVIPFSRYTSKTPVPLRDALRRTNIPISDFIWCIQKGLLVPIGTDTSRIGLQKYLFDPNDLRVLKQNRRLYKTRNWYVRFQP